MSSRARIDDEHVEDLLYCITYPCNPKIPGNTPCYSTSHTSVLDLRWPGIGVHLGELELGLCADTLREGSVADYVAERLSVKPKKKVSFSSRLMFFRFEWVCALGEKTYRSGSYCSKTLRLVWSRMMRALIKPPISRRLALNCDIMQGWFLRFLTDLSGWGCRCSCRFGARRSCGVGVWFPDPD